MKYIIELFKSNLNNDNKIELEVLNTVYLIIFKREKNIHKTDKLFSNALVYMGKEYHKK